MLLHSARDLLHSLSLVCESGHELLGGLRKAVGDALNLLSCLACHTLTLVLHLLHELLKVGNLLVDLLHGLLNRLDALSRVLELLLDLLVCLIQRLRHRKACRRGRLRSLIDGRLNHLGNLIDELGRLGHCRVNCLLFLCNFEGRCKRSVHVVVLNS